MDEKTYCAVHPTVETALRCNKCGRYMCIKCAVKIPVGYRCRECVYEQQDAFYNASRRDDLVALGVAFLIGLPASYILPRAGLFLIIIAALPVGVFIGEVINRANGHRRGRRTWIFALVGLLIATLVMTYPIVIESINLIQGLNEAGRRSADRQVSGLSSRLITQIITSVLLPTLLFVGVCAAGLIARLRGR